MWKRKKSQHGYSLCGLERNCLIAEEPARKSTLIRINQAEVNTDVVFNSKSLTKLCLSPNTGQALIIHGSPTKTQTKLLICQDPETIQLPYNMPSLYQSI